MTHPAENETALLRTTLDYLATHRIFHFRANSGGATFHKGGKSQFVQFGAKGLPDIIAVLGGFFVGIELKSGKNEQSRAQFAFQASLEAARGFYILAYSIDDVIEGLDGVRGTIRAIQQCGRITADLMNRKP